MQYVMMHAKVCFQIMEVFWRKQNQTWTKKNGKDFPALKLGYFQGS
jgi:hypothetical protein